MPSAGIVAVLVGVAIGAVLYYLIGGSEEEQPAHNPGRRSILERSQSNRRSAIERNIHTGYCTICLESLAIATRVILEPCGHIFHKNCIMDWKTKANQQSCPNCRCRFT